MSYPTNELTGYPEALKTEAVHRIDAFRLDEVINTHFPGINFDFVVCEETSNGSAMTYRVDGTLLDYERDEIANGRVQYNASAYLNALAEKNIIPTGKYVVEVCW